MFGTAVINPLKFPHKVLLEFWRAERKPWKRFARMKCQRYSSCSILDVVVICSLQSLTCPATRGRGTLWKHAGELKRLHEIHFQILRLASWCLGWGETWRLVVFFCGFGAGYCQSFSTVAKYINLMIQRIMRRQIVWLWRKLSFETFLSFIGGMYHDFWTAFLECCWKSLLNRRKNALCNDV